MMNGKYDVVVIGGGTAGCSCAWNCGNLGLKTLLIEYNSYLGGSITSSLVIPAMKTSDNSINNDFFNKLYSELEKVSGAITYQDNNRGWFNPELTKIVLDKMMSEAGVDVIFESFISDYKISGEPDSAKILSVSIDSIYNNEILLSDSNNEEEMLSIPIESIHNDNIISSNNKILSLSIESRYFVDTTGDGNFCKKLNCKILENNDENKQPINLRFIMSGIDIDKFANWIMEYDTDRNVTTSCRVGDKTYLSTAYTWDSGAKWALKPIFTEAITNGDLTEEDANYFQIFSVAGTPDSVAFNAPRLIKHYSNRSKAYQEGRFRILKLADFCKKYLPGFENAYISNIANTLGVRVSNRFKGKYVYTFDDLVNGKTFKNPVLISNYPVDIHSDKKDGSTLKKVYKEYQLPVESLIIEGFENLFIAGRCISADFKSQGALRIIPSCFSMGEGLAKYIFKKMQ